MLVDKGFFYEKHEGKTSQNVVKWNEFIELLRIE
jgi:hypothetical protein